MYICKLCNRQFKTTNGLGVHITKIHNISKEEYYLLDNTKNNYCLNCGKETKFRSISYGYNDYCSQYCARHSEILKNKREQTCLTKYGNKNIYATNYGKHKIKETLKEKYNVSHISYNKDYMQKAKDSQFNKIKQYCIDNNYIMIQDIIDEYGSGWYQANIVNLIKYNGVLLVNNDDINTIINYYETSKSSKGQCELLSYIKSIYNSKIYINYRLDNYDLDIYLPELNLAFEYNGIYWHSTKFVDFNYHINKTNLCKEHNIKLVHIFENEWPSEEIKQLIYNKIYNHNLKRGEIITLNLTTDSLLEYDNYTIISNTEPKPHNHNGYITYDCGTITIKIKI